MALVEENGASTRVALLLKQMLGDWLTSHICGIDTRLRDCSAAHHAHAEPAASRRNEIPLEGAFTNF